MKKKRKKKDRPVISSCVNQGVTKDSNLPCIPIPLHFVQVDDTSVCYETQKIPKYFNEVMYL